MGENVCYCVLWYINKIFLQIIYAEALTGVEKLFDYKLNMEILAWHFPFFESRMIL